jgi:hypothetical protein
MRKYLLVWLTLPWLLVDCSSRPVTEADLTSHTFRLTAKLMEPATQVKDNDLREFAEEMGQMTEKLMPVFRFDKGGRGEGLNALEIGVTSPVVWSVRADTLYLETERHGQRVGRQFHIAREDKGFVLLETNRDGTTATNYLEPTDALR